MIENKGSLTGDINTTVKYIEPVKQEKNAIPTKEAQEIIPDEGYTGLSKVTVEAIPDEYVIPEGTLEITENGTHDVTNYKEVVADVHEAVKYKPRRVTFQACVTSELEYEIENLDTSLFTNMQSMFGGSSSLKKLDLSSFDTSNVTNFYKMFDSCYNLAELNLSSFNTSKGTNFSYMFHQCKALTNLDLSNFDMSNATNLSYMFYVCEKLTNLDLSNLDFSSVTDVKNMFAYCSALENLNLGGCDFSKVDNLTNMFQGCTSLTNLEFPNNLGEGFRTPSANNSSFKINLSNCTLLTHDSLMNVINNLYDLHLNTTMYKPDAGKFYTQSLVLGASNLAKLTEEEIAIATNKGWNVT